MIRINKLPVFCRHKIVSEADIWDKARSHRHTHKKPGRVQFRGLSHFSALGREILGKTERKISGVCTEHQFLRGKSMVECNMEVRERERGIWAEIDWGLWTACAASSSSFCSSTSSSSSSSSLASFPPLIFLSPPLPMFHAQVFHTLPTFLDLFHLEPSVRCPYFPQYYFYLLTNLYWIALL